MKKLSLSIFLAVVALMTFAADFSGVISQTYYDGATNQSVEAKWYMSTDNVKLVLNAGGVEATFLVKGEELIIFSDKQVTEDGQPYYFSVSANDIKPTINTDVNTIVLDEKKDNNEVAIEVGGSMNGQVTYNPSIDVSSKYLISFFKNNYEFLVLANQGINGFPISSSLKDKNGVLLSHVETTSIEEKKLSSTDFTIPVGMVDGNSLSK